MSGSSNVVIHGSAMWVFFDGMNANQWSDAGCSAYGNICQVNMAFVSGASSTFWYNAQSKYVVHLNSLLLLLTLMLLQIDYQPDL